MSFFGQNIRFLRNQAQLSQTAFAEIFSLKRAAVGAYEEERAEPKVEVFVKIARHFGVPVEDLICRSLQHSGQQDRQPGIISIPYFGADYSALLMGSCGDAGALAPKLLIPAMPRNSRPIAIEHSGSVLVISEISNEIVNTLPRSKVLVAWDGGASILASSPSAGYAKAFEILYIIKEYHCPDYSELMLGEISRRLSRLEEPNTASSSAATGNDAPQSSSSPNVLY